MRKIKKGRRKMSNVRGKRTFCFSLFRNHALKLFQSRLSTSCDHHPAVGISMMRGPRRAFPRVPIVLAMPLQLAETRKLI